MIRYPSQPTLRKYGLTLDDWIAILDRQGQVCAICKKQPTTGRFCVDHEHVAGFKKMSPEQKKIFVRGLTCWYCNHAYLGRSITIEKSKNVTTYLEEYEKRKNADLC